MLFVLSRPPLKSSVDTLGVGPKRWSIGFEVRTSRDYFIQLEIVQVARLFVLFAQADKLRFSTASCIAFHETK